MTERQPLFADTAWCPQRDWSQVREPLVFRGLDFGLYASIPAVNRGVLTNIDASLGGSPKRAKAAFDGELISESDAMRKGRAAHTVIVEGVDAAEGLLLAKQCSDETKDGKPCSKQGSYRDADGKWYCGTHAKGKNAVKPGDFVKQNELGEIKALAESIKESEALSLFRRPQFEAELTVVWPETLEVVWAPSEARRLKVEITEPIRRQHTLLCKARVDRFAPPARWRIGDRVRTVPGLILDLKTCQSGKLDDKSVSDAIVHNALDIQAVFCRRAMAAIGFPDCDFNWLFAESTAPYDCVAKDFIDDPENGIYDLSSAEAMVDRLLAEYARHDVIGKWPGVCDKITPGRLPKWRAKQLTEIREEMEATA